MRRTRFQDPHPCPREPATHITAHPTQAFLPIRPSSAHTGLSEVTRWLSRKAGVLVKAARVASAFPTRGKTPAQQSRKTIQNHCDEAHRCTRAGLHQKRLVFSTTSSVNHFTSAPRLVEDEKDLSTSTAFGPHCVSHALLACELKTQRSEAASSETAHDAYAVQSCIYRFFTDMRASGCKC